MNRIGTKRARMVCPQQQLRRRIPDVFSLCGLLAYLRRSSSILPVPTSGNQGSLPCSVSPRVRVFTYPLGLLSDNNCTAGIGDAKDRLWSASVVAKWIRESSRWFELDHFVGESPRPWSSSLLIPSNTIEFFAIRTNPASSPWESQDRRWEQSHGRIDLSEAGRL